MLEFFAQFDLYKLLVILHIAGTAIGVGGATLSDILFFRSMRDGKIEKSEFALLHSAGLAVWGGLAIAIFSGIAMGLHIYFENGVNLLLVSGKVQAKTVIVSIILLNGIFLHWKIFPLLKKSLNKDVEKAVFAYHAFPVFTSGAVSAVSWYSAMVIGAWRELSVSSLVILAVYFSILFIAVLTANLLGKYKVGMLIKK